MCAVNASKRVLDQQVMQLSVLARYVDLGQLVRVYRIGRISLLLLKKMMTNSYHSKWNIEQKKLVPGGLI